MIIPQFTNEQIFNFSFDALRSVTYLWVAIELFQLSFVYHFGYEKFKKSMIVNSMNKAFFFLGVYFGIASFLPLIRSIDSDVWGDLVAVTFIFLFPIIYCLKSFMRNSVKLKK